MTSMPVEDVKALAAGHLARAAASPVNGGPTVPPLLERPDAVAVASQAPLQTMASTPIAPQAPVQPPPPPGAPLTDEQRDNAVAQMREEALAQQREAEDNATVYGNGVVPPVAVQGPNGTTISADNLASEAKGDQQKEQRLMQDSVDDETKAGNMAADVAGQQAAARDPADKLLAQRMQDGYAHVQQVEKDVATQSQAAMDNYRKVNDEMHALAVSQPTDLFGQAGVNKALGTIAIFFGGAGMNGAGPNRALEQFQSMADRNVAAQKARFEMLAKVGQGDQTLYGMLQTKLQNTVAVENTLKSMALESQVSMVQQSANQFAGPTARAAAAKFTADAKAKQAKLQVQSDASYQQTAAQAVNIAASHQASQVGNDAAFIAQAEKHQAGSLEGFEGWVPNKAEHARLAKIVGGARNMVSVVNNMEGLSNVKGTPEQKAEAYRKFLVDSAGQFLGARQLLETGTRLEEGELKMIAQFVPDDSEASIKSMSNVDIFKLVSKMQQIRTVVTSIAANQVAAAAPRTTAFSSRDPLWGQYNPRTYRDPLLAATAHSDSNSPQASALAQAPVYPSADF